MRVAENHHTEQAQPVRLAALRRCGAPALLFLITVAMYWRLVLTDQYTWFESPDNAAQVLPWLQFQAGEWHRGHFPLWDPNHWGGQPLLGQAQPGAAYPINWLFFSLPLRHGWLRQSVLNWYYVFARFLAALFCYWLCRELGRSHAASIIGATVFACGSFLAFNHWPQMFNGAVWAPLVLLFLFRSVSGRRTLANACWGGLFLGIAWLSGHHQVPIFLSLTCAFLWSWFIATERPLNRVIIRAAVLFFAFTLLVSGLQTLPAWEYGHAAKRWIGLDEPLPWNVPVPYNIHERYSADPLTVFGIIFPGMYLWAAPFIGMGAAALAALALISSGETRYVRLFGIVAAAGFLVSIGTSTVLHGLLYATVPMIEKARTPAMAIVIFGLSSAVLCAYGIDTLPDLRALRPVTWTLVGIGVITLATVFAFQLGGKQIQDVRIAGAGIYALLFAALFTAWRHSRIGPRSLVVILVVMVMAELSAVCGGSFVNRYDSARSIYLKNFRNSADIIGFLRTRPQPLRISVDDRYLALNVGDFYGVEDIRGYLASVTENVGPLELHAQRMQQVYAVGYYISKEPAWPDQKAVYEGENGLKVFENPDTLPRVRVVRKFQRFPGRDQIATFIADLHNDVARIAPLLEAPPGVEACDGSRDNIELMRHTAGRVTIHAHMQCRGMVVLADTFFTGWNAQVDRQPVRIYEPYGALRGVVVGAGDHVIDMVYRPWTALLGAVMTFSGLLAGVVLIFVGGRR